MAAIRARRGGAAVYPFGIDGFDVYGAGEKLDDVIHAYLTSKLCNLSERLSGSSADRLY
jgi:hypothetical protein